MTNYNPKTPYTKNCPYCGNHVPVPMWKYCDDKKCKKDRERALSFIKKLREKIK